MIYQINATTNNNSQNKVSVKSQNNNNIAFSSIYYLKIPQNRSFINENGLFETILPGTYKKIIKAFERMIKAAEEASKKVSGAETDDKFVFKRGLFKLGKNRVITYFTGEDMDLCDAKNVRSIIKERGIRSDLFIADNYKKRIQRIGISFNTSDAWAKRASKIVEKQAKTREVHDYKIHSRIEYSRQREADQRKDIEFDETGITIYLPEIPPSIVKKVQRPLYI